MKLPTDPGRFSFGATSSTVTSLGIIFGMLTSGNPKANVIGSLLVIAVADNIADSLGIHIYRESTTARGESPHVFTLSNFATRLGITLTFVLFFAVLPLGWAATLSTLVGGSILIFLSYIIAKQRGTNFFKEIAIHLGIAIPVIIISRLLGQFIFTAFD